MMGGVFGYRWILKKILHFSAEQEERRLTMFLKKWTTGLSSPGRPCWDLWGMEPTWWLALAACISWKAEQANRRVSWQGKGIGDRMKSHFRQEWKEEEKCFGNLQRSQPKVVSAVKEFIIFFFNANGKYRVYIWTCVVHICIWVYMFLTFRPSGELILLLESSDNRNLVIFLLS